MRSRLIAASVSVIALALPATAMANGGGSPGAGGLGQSQLAGQAAAGKTGRPTDSGAARRERPVLPAASPTPVGYPATWLAATDYSNGPVSYAMKG